MRAKTPECIRDVKNENRPAEASRNKSHPPSISKNCGPHTEASAKKQGVEKHLACPAHDFLISLVDQQQIGRLVSLYLYSQPLFLNSAVILNKTRRKRFGLESRAVLTSIPRVPFE